VTLSLTFDISVCPGHAVSQEFLFVSHGYLDHIRCLYMYVAARTFFSSGARILELGIHISIKKIS
jgi:hypothetical protein